MSDDKRQQLRHRGKDRGGKYQRMRVLGQKLAKRAQEAISERMMDIFHHCSQDRSVCDIC